MTKRTKSDRKINKALDKGARARKKKVQSSTTKGGYPWNISKLVESVKPSKKRRK